MKLKRFIVISLFSGISAYACACISETTHNYYMFSVYDRQLNGNNYLTRINQDDFIRKINLNWSAYTAGEITSYQSAKLRAYAQRKGDKAMLNYIRLLDLYLKVADSYKETWTYPTKQQLIWRTNTLKSVSNAAYINTRSKIRSQYALLYMRCNMLLKQYATNVKFWNTDASKMPKSVYRDMMLDIYAGCLARTDRGDEACDIFASLGDIPSISTWMNGKRNLKGIQAVYQRNNNSPTLPFLVQEFVNNAQETADDEHAQTTGGMNIYGKLFVNKIYRKEILDFCDFANRVVAEGKTSSPVLWKSAAAWLHFMFGDPRVAQQEIDESGHMMGTLRMMDNARAIRLYISSANANNSESFDNYLAGELEWLYNKAQKEEFASSNYYPNHYTEVLDRLVNIQLVKKYESWNRSDVATALVGVIRHQQSAMQSAQPYYDNTWNPEYRTDYFYRLDSLSAYSTSCYLDYIQQTPSHSIDAWILSHISRDSNYLNDIIGTKYLCSGEYAKAIEYLEKVPLSYLDHQNISKHMASRSFSKEKWFYDMRRPDYDNQSGTHLTYNMKLLFAQKMNDMENKFTVLNDQERIKMAYDIATMYYQASHLGDCWFITHYAWSIGDSARVGEADFVARAVNYLKIAKNSTDFTLKEKSLYALAYIPIGAWYDEVWNDKTNKYVTQYYKSSRQYKALEELADFEISNPQSSPSIYVTRCDVLKQFNKSRNN